MNDDIPEAFKQMISEKNISKKLTNAKDVAEKVSYLCSNQSLNENALNFMVAEESLEK